MGHYHKQTLSTFTSTHFFNPRNNIQYSKTRIVDPASNVINSQQKHFIWCKLRHKNTGHLLLKIKNNMRRNNSYSVFLKVKRNRIYIIFVIVSTSSIFQ